MEVWRLETFLFSIGPSCVNGFSASQVRGMPYGGMLSAGSLGRFEEVGSHVLLEVLLGQVSRRRLGRNGIQSLPMSFSLWGMVEGYAFGRMFGAVMRLFVVLSLLCLPWLPTRRRWWLTCETLLGRKEGGFLSLLDLSMIGNWRKSFVFSIPFKEREFLIAKMT